MYKQRYMDSKNTSMCAPSGTIHVVDPSPLNWLYVLFNTMEEVVRADHLGRIIPSLAGPPSAGDMAELSQGDLFGSCG